jgi:hypothetical protein
MNTCGVNYQPETAVLAGYTCHFVRPQWQLPNQQQSTN